VVMVAGACGGATVPATSSPSAAVVAPSLAPTVAPTSTLVTLSTCTIRAVRWDGTSPLDLTGAWSVDGHGIYFIRQVGDSVWWMGKSGLGEPTERSGQDWANVFEGEMTGNTVKGTYVDLPMGGSLLDGPVELEIQRSAAGDATLVRTNADADTEFEGKVFTPCRPG
jgi:hypothetical protein